MRTFRVSRMTAATVLAGGFERPAKFDLAAHWARATAELEGRRKRYTVVLALAPAAAQMLAPRCPTTPVQLPKTCAPIPDGWVTLRAEFDDESFARFVVLGLGTRVQPLEPLEFREAILKEARAVAGLERPRKTKNLRATS